MATPSALLGRWNIESMDMWGTNAINLVGTAHLTGPGTITGKIRFHRGDESGFVARRAIS